MPEGRVKKPKKARWQVVLGLKQVLCGALGLAWVMVIIFVLGVLAGRGDIYRWLGAWGLVSGEAPRSAQWSPPPETPPAAPVKAPPAAPSAPVAAVPPAAANPAPIPGSITGAGAPSSPAAADKKAKKPASPRDHKASKEEELRRLRQKMASKLKFQNSFDTSPPKSGRAGLKQKDKDKAAKAQAAPVKVARFRDAKSAKAKMAEMQKKGEKVSLKQGKDQEGAYFDLLRQAPAAPQEATVAQKPKKSAGKKTKPRTAAGN